MKLIVGLGNIGNQYSKTRHNTGFIVLDYFLKKNNLTLDKTKFNGKYTKYLYENEEILLLEPMSYMNLSGEVIKKFVDYFNIDINDILIISDDIDMELGKIKLKYKGSSGGHNGLKNISLNLQTENFKRLKIGINNDKKIDTKDYVIGKFTKEELEKIESILDTTNNILEDFLKIEFNKLMSKYNKQVES